MTTLVSRVYAGPQDLQSILDLWSAVRPPARSTVYPAMVDLHELLALKEVQDNTRLWHAADGQVVGFAIVDRYLNLLFELAPQADGHKLESQMVGWGEVCVQRTFQGGVVSGSLDASCAGDDFERIALLERNGFLPQEIRTLHMMRPLDEPIAAPQLPQGFHIRPMAGEAEVAALVRLHRAAFGTRNMTVKERLVMMHLPDYDAELDLVVTAPDGRLAAYCMGAIHREENKRSGLKEGYTDPVAVHPDFQGRGLAKALLLTAMSRLKQRGMQMAVLGTSSENLVMQRAAQSVGFFTRAKILWFSRPVSAAPVSGPGESLRHG